MCCGKPTITVTTMQGHHDNDKIESYNHNEYLLLYKEAEILALRPEVLHVSCNTGIRACYKIRNGNETKRNGFG